MPDIHLLVSREKVEMRFIARGREYSGAVETAGELPERAIGMLLKSARATVRVLDNRAQS